MAASVVYKGFCEDENVTPKAAGDKLLMNKFIRQNFGGGLTLKHVIS